MHNETTHLYKIQVTINDSRASLVSMTSECSEKNAASDQSQHCLLKLQEVED